MYDSIHQAKRIVIKLGTQVVIQDSKGFAQERLSGLISQCAQLHHAGKEILIVSSGAVGLGRQSLNLLGPISLSQKQACAAVGQSLLMEAYRQLLMIHSILPAQVLLTANDFTHRQRYLNLRETLESLLALKVIPIINENDTVSTMELQEEAKTKSFGDNDKLSAIVASKLGADLLVVLTNVDGIYTENPAQNPEAKRISRIENFDQLTTIQTAGQSAYGRGGMSSKIEAARIAAISGVATLILSGMEPEPLGVLFQGGGRDLESGTFITPQGSLPERKRWIGFASGYDGIVIVNEGAKKALVENFKSLLPTGVVGVQGEFQAKQVVSIQDESGIELGRGISNFSQEEIRKIMGRHSREIPEILGQIEYDVVIHRDHLVIFQEYMT